MNDLVLVVGPPRSGTSVVARLLHEKVGICMGHNLVPGNDGNPLGFYEDSVMVSATQSKNVLTWISALWATHTVPNSWMYCDCGKPKGVKTPELAFIDLKALNPGLVIRTWRDTIDNAASLMKWYRPKLTYPQAFAMVMDYILAIEAQLEGLGGKVYTIEMDNHWDETALTELLENICASVVQRRMHAS